MRYKYNNPVASTSLSALEVVHLSEERLEEHADPVVDIGGGLTCFEAVVKPPNEVTFFEYLLAFFWMFLKLL